MKLSKKIERASGGRDRDQDQRARRAGPGAAGDPGHLAGLGRRGVVERGLLRQHRHRVQHVRRGAVRSGYPASTWPGSTTAAVWSSRGKCSRKHGVHNIPCALIPPEASGWFRKEIKTVRRSEGAEDALLRPRGEGDGEDGGRDAAARARRHLPGAAARHDRRHRVLAAVDGPEVRLLPGRQVLLLPRLAPAGDLPRAVRQQEEVGLALRPAQGDHRAGVRLA